jgi:hypothetical protein
MVPLVNMFTPPGHGSILTHPEVSVGSGACPHGAERTNPIPAIGGTPAPISLASNTDRVFTSVRTAPKRLGGVLLGIALLLAACSGPPSATPLRSSGAGAFGTGHDVGDKPFDIAWVVLENKGDSPIRILRVSTHTIDTLDLVGAYLETAPRNKISGGITLAPFVAPRDSTTSPITNFRHPRINPRQEAYLIVRVRIPRGRAAGATKTVTVYYRSSDEALSTTYNMPIALCAKALNGAECSRVRSATAAFSRSD